MTPCRRILTDNPTIHKRPLRPTLLGTMSRTRQWTDQEWREWAARQPSPPWERTPGARERAQQILDGVARRLLDEQLERETISAGQPGGGRVDTDSLAEELAPQPGTSLLQRRIRPTRRSARVLPGT